MARVGQPASVKVVLNDTVAVLAASCYLDSATRIGIILGTGEGRLGC